jgi:hypothetical protein
MYFSIILLHSILNERNKYGPIGWISNNIWMNSVFEINFMLINANFFILGIFLIKLNKFIFFKLYNSKY